MKKLILLSFLMLSYRSMAQGLDLDNDMDFDEPVQKSRTPIDIEGSLQPVQKPVRTTAADRMKLYRAKLEAKSELQMKKRMEYMRVKAEMEMYKKMNTVFENMSAKLDEVE